MKVLAIDLGASSGRAILGNYDNDEITLEEIHRFDNTPVERESLCWDIDALFNEIKTSIKKCASKNIHSISIDTWGCDFALLGADGRMVHSPLHYRDKITEGIMNEVFNIINKEALYEHAGIEFMRYNTIFQLYALKKIKPEIFEKTDKLLFMPDLFTYLLTGIKSCEKTIASTSGIINLVTGQPDEYILQKIGIKKSLFPEVCKSPQEAGFLKDDLARELGVEQIKIITGAGHDTANAVVAAPLKNEDSCYISCGTWSLLGIESKSAITNNAAYNCNFTNESGFDDTVLFLKNISGLWLLHESRNQWKRESKTLSYAEIEAAISNNISSETYLDVELNEFSTPGNLPSLFNKFFKSTGQRQLKDKIDIVQCILESLALSYDYRIRQLEHITGKKFKSINIIGGGSKDTNLMRFTANATGKKVISGPAEATAMGNVIIQLIAADAVKSVKDARDKIDNLITYLPENEELWNRKREKFLAIIGAKR
jgi:rhamnulokinase/L-fuculokinase